MLHLFKHMSDEDMYGHLLRIMKIISEISERKTMLEILEPALRYTYHARNEDEKTVRKYIEEGIEYFDDIKAGEVAMTVADRLEKKGEIRGRSVLIQKQLNKKFGLISSVLERKLQDSRLDILDKFGESIFDFNNLKDAEKWWDDFEKKGNA